MTPADRQAELHDLLRRLSDGQLGPEDCQRLNDLLLGNPEACELYLDHVGLDAHLHREFGQTPVGYTPQTPVADTPGSPKAAGSPVYRWMALFHSRVSRFAAAVLLGVSLTLLSLPWLEPNNEPQTGNKDDEGTRGRAFADSVATLLFADNCEWGKKKPIEGQRLSVGALHLERGLAVLRFDGGAAVVLEGPTDLDLESRGSARLASGRLTVRAPEQAAGFTVHTPASDVVDLGTEFAVVVERSGATELHVLEGEISYGKPGTPQEMADLLGAGNAVRYDQARESAPRAVPLNAPRFTELLRQAKIGPREDLLLAYEGFDYPVGRLPLDKANGGTGWAGPWRPSPGAKKPFDNDGDLTIAFGKLHVPWPVLGGRGSMLEAPPEYTSRCRSLAQPVCLDEDGVYYVSVLLRWEAAPPPPVGPVSPLPSVRLVLRSSTNFQGDHVMFNLPAFQRPQIDIRSGAIFTSATTVARDETQFWVGKIVARRQGEDEIFFKVYGENETLDTIEPADWSVRSRGVRSDARLDVLLLSKFGGGTCWWDEVRIGKSWRAVVPPAGLAKNPK
jgi:hypothetical protein